MGLTLHIDVLSHQSVPAMPSIDHLDYSICARLTAKHGSIVEFGRLSVRGTSCDAGRERLLPNLASVQRDDC
jgi:hypothetical protein